MSRTELIQHIQSLSASAFRRVAPYLAADLESASDLVELHDEIRLGLKSAREEPLAPSAAVHRRLRAKYRGA